VVINPCYWFYRLTVIVGSLNGMRVARQLRRRHEVLVAEAKRCESMVADEVGKVKAEMGIEIGQLKALIEK
jgi:hypothetical protein